MTSFEATQTFGARLRQAAGDPGSIVVRRGTGRDGTAVNGDPIEPLSRWVVGAVVRVLHDRLDELRGVESHGGDSRYADGFEHGWEAALDALAEDLRVADDYAERIDGASSSATETPL